MTRCTGSFVEAVCVCFVAFHEEYAAIGMAYAYFSNIDVPVFVAKLKSVRVANECGYKDAGIRFGI